MSSEWQRAGEALPGDGLEGLAPRYLAFFDCFNTGRFFEAHEVLEPVWLPARSTPDARFYQGLIQLAGAFVHLDKQRPAPALRLLRSAQAHLAGYPAVHFQLDLTQVRALIVSWIDRLDAPPGSDRAGASAAPPQLPLPTLRAA